MAGFRSRKQKQVPIRLSLSGDKEQAKQMLPVVVRQLKLVEKGMQRMDRKQGVRKLQLDDGSIVEVGLSFGLAWAKVFVPVRREVVVSGRRKERLAAGLVFAVGGGLYYCIKDGTAELFMNQLYGNSHHVFAELVGGETQHLVISIDLPRPEMNQVLDGYTGYVTYEMVRWLHTGMLVEIWEGPRYFQLYQVGELLTGEEATNDLGGTYHTYYGSTAALSKAMMEALGTVELLSAPKNLYLNGKLVKGFPKPSDGRMVTGAALTKFPASELTPSETQLYILLVLIDFNVMGYGSAVETLYRAPFRIDEFIGEGRVGDLEFIAELSNKTGAGAFGTMRGLRRCWQFNSDCTKINNNSGSWFRNGSLVTLDKELLTVTFTGAAQTLLPESTTPVDYGTRYTIPSVLTTVKVVYLGIEYSCPPSYHDSSRTWFGVTTHTGLHDWTLSSDASVLTLKAATTMLEIASYEDEFVYAVFDSPDTPVPFTLLDSGINKKTLVVDDLYGVTGTVKVYNTVGVLLETYIETIPVSYVGCFANNSTFDDSRYRLEVASGFEITVDESGNVLAKTARKLYYNWEDATTVVPGLEELVVDYNVGKLGLI